MPERHDHEPPPGGLLDRRRMRRGLATFVVLSLAGLGGLFLVARPEGTLAALGRIEPLHLVLALALVPLDLFLGGLRNHVLLARLHRGVPVRLSVRANLANVFMGAVTPSQVGGGLAQIYVFERGGVPVASAAAVTVVTFLTTLTVFVAGGGAALAGLHDSISGAVGKGLVRYSAVAVAVAGAAFVVLLWRPVVAGRSVRRLGAASRRWIPRVGARVERIGDRAIQHLERYHDHVAWFMQQGWRAVTANLVVNCALYLVKFTIGYVLVLGLGVEAGYWQVVAIQALLLAIVYFAPTPGGSGVAELGTGAFMSLVLPSHLLAVYALLSRFFLVYLQAAAGAVVMIRQVSGNARAPHDEGASG